MAKVHLFVGPKGTGRWTEAERIRKEKSVGNTDVLRVRKLTATAASDIVNFSLFAPIGEEKLCIIRLPSSTTKAVHTLLKILEDAPDFMTFILISKEMPIETIVSRSHVRLFSLLTEEEVALKLLNKRGIGAVSAKNLASKSGGQVSRAYEILEGGEHFADVSKMVKALLAMDVEKVESLAPVWTEEHSNLLSRWAREAITGKWAQFQKSDVPRVFALRVLMALNTKARPRLVVRSVLTDLIRK